MHMFDPQIYLRKSGGGRKQFIRKRVLFAHARDFLKSRYCAPSASLQAQTKSTVL